MKRKMAPPSRSKPSSAHVVVNPPPVKKIKKTSIQGERLQSSDNIISSILSCFTISEAFNEHAFISKKFYQVSRSEQFWSTYNIWAQMQDPPKMFYANLYLKCFGTKWSNLTL